jgi:DMSO/TMAO reductase YedYZ molybdopterin-dependent catalytic subunit
MNARHIALLAGLALFGAQPLRAAEPAGGGIVVQGPGGAVPMSAEDIAALPMIQLNIGFATEHGPRQANFEGPLLWTVLDHAHAIDPAKPRESVRQTILLTGQDGYTAVLAVGEISPEFENKQVILAERMDGKPLDHPRIVVPGDKRGGRGVHDLVRIAVLPATGG